MANALTEAVEQESRILRQMKSADRNELCQAVQAIVPQLKRMRARNSPNERYGLQLAPSGIDIHEITALLADLFPFSKKLVAHAREGIASDAVFAEIQNEDFTEQSLLACICQKQGEFLRKPLAPYVVLTHLSFSLTDCLPSPRRIGYGTISFPRDIGHFNRSNWESRLSSLNIPLWPPRWMPVTVACRARTPYEAGEIGIDAANLTRAIWNLARNRRLGFSFSMPVERPINEIRMGPLHTVHALDGSSAGDAFFYETPCAMTDYPGRPKTMSRQEFVQKVLFERQVKSSLRTIRYRDELENILREYVSTLDEPSTDGGFARLWTILEQLTHAIDDGKASYDLLVRRAAAIFRPMSHAPLSGYPGRRFMPQGDI